MKLIQSHVRAWRHKSVRSLMRAAGSGDPIKTIRQKAKELVAKAKAQGWEGPPYDPLLLASLQGIRSRRSNKLFSAEAQLTPLADNQLLLEFNPDRAPSRQNYSISHEIVHTLFDNCYEMVHQRNSDRAAFDPEQEVEHLCQVGAAEILMPEEDFERDVARLGFSLKSVRQLSEKYVASREAVARRMLTLAGQTGALVFLSRRLKPVEERNGPYSPGAGPEKKMRVLYTVSHPNFHELIPRHKSVPDDSCVYAVKIVDDVTEGDEFWNISGETYYWHIEATALPLPEDAALDSPSVMVLITPKF